MSGQSRCGEVAMGSGSPGLQHAGQDLRFGKVKYLQRVHG